jgi:4-amino-4-deoxy-L-arabinose transferase-like glycosyltransferase
VSDRWIALALALAAFVILFATEKDLGVAWDEPVYIENGQRIVTWLGTLASGLVRGDLSQALDGRAIGLSFGLNNEHPPLAKVASGLGWALTRGWLPLPTAHRVGPMALAAALVALIYVAVRQAGAGRAGALVGALALLDMPRVFFHAHLAELDLPAAAAWFLAMWAFWRLSQRRDVWAWLLTGLAFGIALATKISDVLAPLGMGLWLLTARDRRTRWYLWGRLIVAAPLGLGTVIVLFPWFWSETGQKVWAWVRFFTVSHYEIYQYYLGQSYLGPPWHFPIVMIVATVPVLILALAVIGAGRAVRAGPVQPAAALWLINALLIIAWFLRPGSRAFDGDRLLMPAYVFLAPLAGVGFDAIVGRIRHSSFVIRPSSLVALILATIVLAPGAIASAQLHPFELAYYSEAVGGVAGARRLQLETIYWATTYAARCRRSIVAPRRGQRCG